MSNLSELLPAGAGAKSADFVASGTLGSGVTVALKSDGTVEAVGITPQSDGTPVVFESADTTYTGTTFDSNSNKIVIAYQDNGNSGYGTAIVGTVSGTSISFGSAVVFESASSNQISATFDSSANKVVIAYRDGGTSYGTAIVGTVSGTSISFGSAVVFESASVVHTSSNFDTNANKIVIAYKDFGNSSYGTAVVGTVSGTSISFGTPVVFETSRSDWISSAFDSNSNKIVVAYEDVGNSSYGTSVVGTVSGTSISFGSPVVFESAFCEYTATAFDANSNKIVIAYNQSTANNGKAVVGTVSGTSISFGTPVVFETSSTQYNSAIFDTNAKKIVIGYRNNGDGGDGYAIAGTVSGTDISFGSTNEFETGSTKWISSAFDSNSNKVVFAYEDDSNLDYGTAVVYQTESSNSADFIGITDQAIANTATGAVIIQGGVSEKVTGLTTGSDYYVQDNGTLSTTVSSVPAGRALSTTSILLEG